jgi:hypothetical protein
LSLGTTCYATADCSAGTCPTTDGTSKCCIANSNTGCTKNSDCCTSSYYCVQTGAGQYTC